MAIPATTVQKVIAAQIHSFFMVGHLLHLTKFGANHRIAFQLLALVVGLRFGHQQIDQPLVVGKAHHEYFQLFLGKAVGEMGKPFAIEVIAIIGQSVNEIHFGVIHFLFPLSYFLIRL